MIIIVFFLKNVPGEAYLKRQEKISVPLDYPIDEKICGNEENYTCDDQSWSDELEAETDPFEASVKLERPLILEHHVLWSMSYGVPTIYFNGWKSGEFVLFSCLKWSFEIEYFDTSAQI